MLKIIFSFIFSFIVLHLHQSKCQNIRTPPYPPIGRPLLSYIEVGASTLKSSSTYLKLSFLKKKHIFFCKCENFFCQNKAQIYITQFVQIFRNRNWSKFLYKFYTNWNEETKLNHWVNTQLNQLVIQFEPFNRCFEKVIFKFIFFLDI